METLFLTIDKQFVLADAIAKNFGKQLLVPEVITFADSEFEVRLPDPGVFVGKRVCIIQSTYPPVNDHLIQLLFTIHALKNAGAVSIVGLIPYFGYARHEESPQFQQMPGEAAAVAAMLEVVGLDEVMAVALHADDVSSFFSIPTNNITVIDLFAEHIQKNKDSLGVTSVQEVYLIAPDRGAKKRVKALAEKLGCSYYVFTKERYAPDETRIVDEDLQCTESVAIIIDDIIDTGGTALHAAEKLVQQGVKHVFGYFVHPVFSGDALSHLKKSPIERLWVTDSIPHAYTDKQIEVVSLAPLLAQTLKDFKD